MNLYSNSPKKFLGLFHVPVTVLADGGTQVNKTVLVLQGKIMFDAFVFTDFYLHFLTTYIMRRCASLNSHFIFGYGIPTRLGFTLVSETLSLPQIHSQFWTLSESILYYGRKPGYA